MIWISIHAPAKGATGRRGGGTGMKCISIHAPAKGATPPYPKRPPCRCHFNPRSRKGSDLNICINPSYLSYNFNPRSRKGSDDIFTSQFAIATISIHAPAKGATLSAHPSYPRKPISIHAPAKGATGLHHQHACNMDISIHAPAKGATKDRKTKKTIIVISIHAPAKGATAIPLGMFKTTKISIHAPAKGATRHGDVIKGIKHISIHAPAKGATCLHRNIIIFLQPFQSTLPQRERPVQTYNELSALGFQSTLPQRERRFCCFVSFARFINFNPRSRKGSDAVWA